MALHVREGDIHLNNVKTRIPLRCGNASLSHLPLAFVRVAVEMDGRTVFGVAADGLLPHHFTRTLERDPDLEIRELLAVVARTLEVSIGIHGESPFEIWQELHETQDIWSETEDVPPQLAHFGTALVERAVIDAFCRGMGDSFYRLLLSDQLGLEVAAIHPELAGKSAADLLPSSPCREASVRHNISTTDPLAAAEIPTTARIQDGLPYALDECISAHALRHFRIQLSGDLDKDRQRLEAIESQLSKLPDYDITLDGDEQFGDLAAFKAYWSQLTEVPAVQRLSQNSLTVEQPIHRDHALDVPLTEWSDRPPILIDESDANLTSLPLALKLGYAGTIHRNCKGAFRGIANACLLEHRRRKQPDRQLILGAGDLSSLGPVSLQQDLAVAAALGVDRVDCTGHHHVAGLSWLPPEWQALTIRSHGDLYRTTEQAWPSLDVREGRLRLASVNESPFGLRFLPDPSAFTPAADWHWPPADA